MYRVLGAEYCKKNEFFQCTGLHLSASGSPERGLLVYVSLLAANLSKKIFILLNKDIQAAA
jgi:hypothetical protein